MGLQECSAAVWIAWRGGSSDRSIALVVAEGEGLAARPVDDRAQLPPSDDLVGPAGRIRKEHSLSAKRKIIAAIDRDLLLADIVIPAFARTLVPGCKAAGEIDALLPRVVDIQREPLGVLLGQGDLQCVEVAVLIVAIIADIAAGVAATPVRRKDYPGGGSGGQIGSRLAGRESSTVVTSQIGSGIGAAIDTDAITVNGLMRGRA